MSKRKYLQLSGIFKPSVEKNKETEVKIRKIKHKKGMIDLIRSNS